MFFIAFFFSILLLSYVILFFFKANVWAEKKSCFFSNRYVEAEEIDGATFWGESAFYPGGGFLVRLEGNKDDTMKKIRDLKNEKFIDQYTRAIFHEFAVYNPTYNLFAVVTMVAEFRASSGVFAYYYCEPLRLIMYHGATAPYQVLLWNRPDIRIFEKIRKKCALVDYMCTAMSQSSCSQK